MAGEITYVTAALTIAHKGDIGRLLVYSFEESIASDATVLLYARKPDDTVVTWTATVYSTTQIAYTTIASTDLSVVGTWALQGYLQEAGRTLRGTVENFEVEDVL